MLATSETLGAAAPSGLTATPSSINIALSWSAASGASNYRVERRGAGGSYGLLGATTGTSITDSSASSGSAYLYRVCAADGGGNCLSDYSNIALGARLNFPTDSTLTAYSENPSNATTIKAAHITELRTAINAVRSLAGLSSASWTNNVTGGATIYADDVRELRARLNDALVALSIQTSTYTDNTITSYAEDPLNATTIKAVHIRELRQRATSGSGTSGSGGSAGGLKYVLTDVQGGTRAIMNNNGSSSAVIARHDYLPFGEEIGSGIGLRSSGQGYGGTDRNRKKFGLTERDDATGLDHAWWRKYEDSSGRWTSPDPLGGSIADPQSFNRYSYVQNDPVNLIDPLGLFCVDYERWDEKTATLYVWSECYLETGGGPGGYISPIGGGPAGDPGGSTGGPPIPAQDIDKTYSRVFNCNRSANDLFRTLRRDFSKFANFTGPLAGGLGTAGIHFDKGPITQGRVINISAGGMSNVPIAGGLPSRTKEMSVTVSSTSTMSFTFTTNPGHVLYPGTIAFSASDADPGRVSASVVAKGNIGDAEARGFFLAGGGSFEDAVWKNFLDNLQRSCGSLK